MIKLTKEQEEAIERLKEDVKYSDLADVDDDCTICFIEDVEIVLNLIQGQQKENEKKNKMIYEIQKEVSDYISFENRLKRDNREPDLFNQGRFYVANNIKNILKGKEKMEIEELEKHCEQQLKRLSKTSKMYDEHLLILAIIKTNKQYFEEIEKKDKMIDEIIGFIATRTWATCPNEDCGANLDCENRCSNDDNIYEECWKMYFENQTKM